MLQRRGPIARKTPMEGGKPLGRGKPAVKRPAKPTGHTHAQRDVQHERDGYACVICGRDLVTSPIGYSSHHRQNRGMGGRKGASAELVNAPGNGIDLCGSGTTGCHGWITDPPRDVGREHTEHLGWIVPYWRADPGSVPVWTHAGWKLLTADGRALDLDAPVPPFPHHPGDTRENGRRPSGPAVWDIAYCAGIIRRLADELVHPQDAADELVRDQLAVTVHAAHLPEVLADAGRLLARLDDARANGGGQGVAIADDLTDQVRDLTLTLAARDLNTL